VRRAIPVVKTICRSVRRAARWRQVCPATSIAIDANRYPDFSKSVNNLSFQKTGVFNIYLSMMRAKNFFWLRQKNIYLNSNG
jgi:hypothetical protein